MDVDTQQHTPHLDISLAGNLFRRRQNELHNNTRPLKQKIVQCILESAGEGILGIDADGLATFVNPAVTKMLGFTPEELIGKDIHALFHHSHEDGSPFPSSECPMTDAARNGVTYERIADVLWRKDNTPLPVTYSCAPMNHDKGYIKGAVIVFRDNTELRQTLDALHEAHITLYKRVQEGVAELLAIHGALAQEATLRQNVQTELQVVNELLDLSQEGITITDANGTIRQVNRAFTTQ